MTDETARRLAWMAFGSIALLYLVGLVLFFFSRQSGTLGQVLFGLVTFSFPLVGIVILSRHAKNVIGWIMLAIGLSWSLGVPGSIGVLTSYGHYLKETGSHHTDLAAILGGWLWVPAVGLMGTFLILLFPDGRLPSPGWRVVAWFAGLAIAGTSILSVLTPRSLAQEGYPGLTNPLGLTALRPVLGPLQSFVLLIPLSILASAVGLIVRFRRSRGSERLQLKWLTAAAAAVASLYLLAFLLSPNAPWGDGITPTVSRISEDLMSSSFGLIPVAVGLAILKHNLYDIDVVINRTLVYGALAAFITVVYIAVVVGVGALFGASGKPNLALSIAATATVALAFQPVRERVEKVANRLVYGRRSTPYEVLSQFAGPQTGQTEIVQRMARVLAEGTGAHKASVWLAVEEELMQEAVWPAERDEGPVRVPLDNGSLPALPFADCVAPVLHRGDLLGALTVTKRYGEQPTPIEQGLVNDLASQAGLVLRNERLTAELRVRLADISRQAEELRASRGRIVAAQDKERRRLERNIHDGAQQHLVALAVKVRLVKAVIAKDTARGKLMIGGLKDQAAVALATLRDLAQGVYPPALTESGIATALGQQAAVPGLEIVVEDSGIGRFSIDAEAAVYFACLEAIQNVAKYAQARRCLVTLSGSGRYVDFTVTDDGRGFEAASISPGSGLTGMTDRIGAAGGEVSVMSVPGAGTTVAGRVPRKTLKAVS